MRQVVVLALTVAAVGCHSRDARVVVYCAQDQEFAEGVFADFETSAGLTVAPKFDTEANKSVSLAASLEAERSRPRCDVHWNNEILNTIRLARAGVYEPYQAPEASNPANYPVWTYPGDKTWQAFAARARVLLVNTDLVAEADRPASLFDLTGARWKGKIVMAKPQFGTTATQAACLLAALGPDEARRFYRGLKANDVRIVPGNKQAATEVSGGRAAVGLTDSDDAMVELNAGKRVAIVFPDRHGHPRHPSLGTLVIPNAVALVRGGPNPAGGRRLIDYLLGLETARRLASGGAFQIPVHMQADPKDCLPPPMHPVILAKRMAVDFEKAADRWDEAQSFLREEFAR